MAKPKVARPKTDEKYTSPQAGVVQNNSNRALELGETYRRLGGTDTALLPNYARMNPLPDASIPVLERAILDTANTLQGRASINRTGDKQPLDMSNVSPLNAFLQGATGLNRASERNRLQQTDRAVDEIRNARTEQILSDIGQSDRFNSFREHPILAEQSLVGLLTGRTSLTPEMREAGLTQTDINTYLGEIKNEGIRTGSRDFAEDHPALATAASIGLNPLYSLTNSVKNVGNYIAGNPLENYINPANELRQNVSEGIDSKVGQFAYNVGNSAADMLTAMLLPGSAAGTMGLEKASEVINGAVDRGLTPDQILAEGIGSGVTTAATEAIPLGKFSQGGNIFGAMLAEGLQEGSEDIADTILDQLVTQLGGNTNRSELITQLRAYLDAGYSPDDAVNAVKADYFKQLGLDVLAGGITGGLMGAGSNALQGRNIITGNIPTLNNETQTEVNETVPEVAQPEEQPVAQQTVNEVPLTEDEEVHNAEQRIMNFVYGLQRGTVADPRAEYNNVLADVEAVKAKYPNAASWLDTMLFINQPTINQKLNLFQPEEVQPVEALNSPLENAQQIVDNFSNSLKNGSIQSREQASQGLQNISQALNAIAEQNPEIRSDIKTIWDNFIQSITPQRNQPTEEVGIQNEVPEAVQPESEVAQPVAEETVQPEGLTRRQITEYRSQRDAIKSNLAMFKGTKKLQNRLDKAFSAIEQNQPNAVENFNNVVNEINEEMAGETVGVSQREVMSDLYRDMKEVTDGYKIRVSKDAIRQLGLSNDTYNELKNRLYTGKNSITFVEKGGTPIDSAYMEMYDQAHGGLPSPQNMAEGDLLKALYKYITDAKSSRGETAMETAWEDIPLSDGRSDIERQWIDRSNDILDRIDDGTLTEEEYEQYAKDFAEFGSNEGRSLPENVKNELVQMRMDALTAYKNMAKSKVRLDEDIRNITTPEEAEELLDREVSSIPFNLGIFGGEEVENEVDIEDDGRVKTDRFKTSEAYTNTAENSGILTDRQRKMHEADNSMLWEENSEQESVDEAHNRLAKNGYVNEYDRLLEKSSFNNVDTDEAMMIWRSLTEDALALDERGMDSESTWQKAHDIFDKIQNEASKEGSALQALAKWSRNNTAEGLLSQAGSIIKRVRKGASSANPNWNSQIARETKGKTTEMDVAFIKEFLTEAKKLEGLDMDSRDAKHIMANLGKLVNSRIPVTLREKITTILMDNMLGNFRTLVTRNAGGNIGFNLVEQIARKPLSALIDKAVAKRTGVRTTSGITREGMNAYRDGFLEGLKQEIYDFKNDIQSARSGENTLHTAVGNNRQIFSNKNVFGKIGNLYNKLVKSGLSIGDRMFYEGVYDQSIAEYEKLYADHKLGDMSREDFEKLSKAYARLNALEAVYQDDSRLAEAFISLKQGVAKISEGITGADLLSQFTMPFVKTPANIIERSIEYSPVGIIKNAIQTVRELRHAMTEDSMMDFNQDRFVRETARNIVGTGWFLLGLMLANAGGLTGGYSEDKDMAQAQKEAGMQEYALHNPLGSNMDVDISWVPVLGNNMVAAAASYHAANQPELSMSQAMGRGATAGLKSQFESSMLQGLQRMFGGSGAFGEDGDILTNAVDTFKSGGTQLIPSLLRQAAAASDPYRRQLSGPDKDDYYINNVLNSIPGLRQNLEPRIGRTGEELEQNPGRSTAWKLFDNFINPATITVGTPDAVRDEAMRLFDATQDNRAFEPAVTMTELKVDDHVPTSAEFTEYQRNAYGAMNEAAQQLINSEEYSNLSDEEKVNMLAELYSAIKTVEKKNVLDLDKSGLGGAEKAYDENGIDGLLEYYVAKNYLDQMGLSNNPSNREYVINAMHEGTEAVEQLVQDSQILADSFSDNMVFKYNHAQQYIPSLDAQSFANLFHAIDTEDPEKESIKQSELLAYLNQNPTSYDYDTVMSYWNAFGSWQRTPYFDENSGTWKV